MPLDIAWCGPEAAADVRTVTREAFAPQAALDPPSGALSESEDAVRADLDAGTGVLARSGGRPVAACRVTVHARHFDVRRVAVSPACQGRGIGAALMDWVEAEATRAGMSEVRLGVRNALAANRAWYERRGYRAIEDHGYWTELSKAIAGKPAHGTEQP